MKSNRPVSDFEDTHPGDFAWVPCFCDRGRPCEVCDNSGRKAVMVKRTISGQHKRVLTIDILDLVKT